MIQDDFEKILKEHGLKKTKQRILVLETLASCGDRHLTAEEIYEIVETGAAVLQRLSHAGTRRPADHPAGNFDTGAA